MNQTEAWETVEKAALERLIYLTRRAKTPAKKQECRALRIALIKVGPRVHRMRARLDFSRAKKAGKQSRPSWATP